MPTRHKGRSNKEKLTAVWLYSHGLSFREISKFLKVNVGSVFVWVKKFAEENYSKPKPVSDSVVIELDEMWHFLRSKKDLFGFGRLIAGRPDNLLTGSAAREVLKHLKKSTGYSKNGT